MFQALIASQRGLTIKVSSPCLI